MDLQLLHQLFGDEFEGFLLLNSQDIVVSQSKGFEYLNAKSILIEGLHPQDVEVFQGMKSGTLFGGLSQMKSIRLLDVSKKYVSFLVKCVAYTMPDNTTHFFLSLRQEKIGHFELQEVLDALPFWFGVYTTQTDVDGNIVDFKTIRINQNNLNRLLADDIDQILGKGLFELIPDAKSILFPPLLNVYLTGTSAKMELNHIPGKSNIPMLEVHAARWSRGVVLYTFDITERKKQELEILNQNELLSNTLELTQSGSWKIDIHTLELTLSPSLAKLLDLDTNREALIINDLLSNVHPDDERGLLYTIEESLTKKKACQIEYRLINKNKEIKYLITKTTPIRNIDGKVSHIVGSTQDISALVERNIKLEEALENEISLNYQLSQREEELTSKEEELRQTLEELSTINEELNIAYKTIIEKEKQTAAIFDNTKDLIVIIDEKHKITYVNAAFLNLAKNLFYGKPILGSPIFDFLPESKHDFYRDTYHKAFEGEYITQTTDNYEPHTGRYVSEEIYIPIRNDYEVYLVGIFIRDITDKVLAEEQVKDLEAIHSSILNSSEDYISSFDRSYTFTAANSKIIEELKNSYNVHFQLGKTNLSDFLAEPLKQTYFTYIDKAFQGESTITQIEHSNLFTGRKEYTQDSFYPIYNEKKEIVGVSVFSKIITEILEAQRKVKENETLLLFAQKVAKLGHWILDLKSKNVQWSDELYNIFEVSKDFTPTYHAFFDLLPEPSNLEFKELMHRMVKYKEPFEMEFTLQTLLGDDKNIQLIANPNISESGQVYSVPGTLQDVTELKKKEKEIRKKTQELLDATRKMSDYRLMALRAVMNPHFLFNSLNSIQYFITRNERSSALSYLSLFSKLIRNILNSCMQAAHTLAEEIKLLEMYTQLEMLRFENKFICLIEADPKVDTENIEIPSLILQPYVENAILHGLCNKEGNDGRLHIYINQFDEQKILVTIEDNGIGRIKALEIKQQNKMHKSVGMLVTQERLQLINNDNKLSVNIVDLVDSYSNPCGTRVEVYIDISHYQPI